MFISLVFHLYCSHKVQYKQTIKKMNRQNASNALPLIFRLSIALRQGWEHISSEYLHIIPLIKLHWLHIMTSFHVKILGLT